MDGKHYFYVNPLEADPRASHGNPGKNHINTRRSSWFACACCPSNITRLLASIDKYMYEVNDDVILSHQFIANDTTFKNGVEVNQESNFPWSGDIKFTITNQNKEDFKFGIRIPSWSRNKYDVKVNGDSVDPELQDGIIYILVSDSEMTITLSLDMDTKLVRANTKVKDDMNKVAIQRGPVVYCAEEADNKAPLWDYRLDDKPQMDYKYEKSLLDGVGVIETSDAKMAQEDGDELYYTDDISWKPAKMTFIPYYAWANRSEGQMRVWQDINR